MSHCLFPNHSAKPRVSYCSLFPKKPSPFNYDSATWIAYFCSSWPWPVRRIQGKSFEQIWEMVETKWLGRILTRINLRMLSYYVSQKMMKMEKMIMKLTSALEWNFAFEIELKRPLSLCQLTILWGRSRAHQKYMRLTLKGGNNNNNSVLGITEN